jgi:hypothetical protein
VTTRSIRAIKFSGWALGVGLLSSTLLVASNAANNPFAGHLHVISTSKSGTTSASAAAAPTSGIARMPIWWGGNAFILAPASSMSDTPVTAQGYEYVLPIDLSNRWKILRSAFNVTGVEQKNIYGWQINGDEQNPGSLYLNLQGVGSWSYYSSNFAVSQGCVAKGSPTATPMPGLPGSTQPNGPTAASGTSGAPSTNPGPAVWPCPTPVGDPQSISKAIELAKKVHVQIGGPTNVEWTGQANAYNASVDVTAVPLINGTKTTTGWATSWHYTIASDGKTTTASGSFANPVALRNLPVLGARSAAERVNGKQWSAFGPFVTGGYPVGIMNSGAAPGTSEDVAGQINIGINRIAVKSPVATLIEFWGTNGTLLLLPGYQYSADKGEKFAVIAVSESRVTFTQVDNSGIQPMMK